MSSTLLWKDLFIARSSYWDQRRVFAFVAFQLCCKTMAENHILRPPWHTMKGISCPKDPGHNKQLTVWPGRERTCYSYYLANQSVITHLKIIHFKPMRFCQRLIGFRFYFLLKRLCSVYCVGHNWYVSLQIQFIFILTDQTVNILHAFYYAL